MSAAVNCEMLEGLKLGSSNEERELALEYWAHRPASELQVLILTSVGKEYWEGIADVFCLLSRAKVEALLPMLIEWLRDLNWPGASKIFEIFLKLPRELSENIIQDARLKAKGEGDEDWLDNLRLLLDAIYE